MAVSYNRVLVGGALTCDPWLRFLPDGTAEACFGLLLEVDVDPAAPVGVRCRGALAEHVVDALDRGGVALVAGRLSNANVNGFGTLEVLAHEVFAL